MAENKCTQIQRNVSGSEVWRGWSGLGGKESSPCVGRGGVQPVTVGWSWGAPFSLALFLLNWQVKLLAHVPVRWNRQLSLQGSSVLRTQWLRSSSSRTWRTSKTQNHNLCFNTKSCTRLCCSWQHKSTNILVSVFSFSLFCLSDVIWIWKQVKSRKKSFWCENFFRAFSKTNWPRHSLCPRRWHNAPDVLASWRRKRLC